MYEQNLASYVDTEGALSRVRGNKTLYKRMLSLFLQSKEIAELEECIEKGEYAKGSEVAHALKGMSGNLSLPAVFEFSTKLMEQMREGAPDPQTLLDYRAAIKETIPRIEYVTDQIDKGLL